MNFSIILEFSHLFIKLFQEFHSNIKQRIIHRDLKFENILYKYNQENDQYSFVLTDFNTSKFTSSNITYN